MMVAEIVILKNEMRRFKFKFWSLPPAFIALAILIFYISQILNAAQVTIDATVSTAIAKHQLSGKQIVCISDQVCYAFYIDATNAEDIVYSKSTNAGASWGTPAVISAGTWLGMAIWYDRWTPGDTTGNYVHLAFYDNGDSLFYSRFNTSNDSFSTAIDASGAAEGTLAAGNDIAVTKGTDGDLYVGTVDATAPTAGANFIEKCPVSADCTNATNWVAAGTTNPWDGVGDDLDGNFDLIMLPLAGGNLMLVSTDVALEDIEYKIYTDSSNTWSTNFTDIDTNAPDSTTFTFTLSGTADIRTNTVYISYVANVNITNTSEVRAWKYQNSTWTQFTDPWPDTTDGVSLINDASIGIGTNINDLYVAYIRDPTNDATNNGNVYFRRSKDGGVSWQTEQLLSNGTTGDMRGVSIVGASNERLFGVWFNPTPDDIFGNTVVNLASPSYEQSAFRWFQNNDATTVGSPLANQDTGAEAPEQGTPFRLRTLLHVGGDGATTSLDTFKLQYAVRSGTCDTSFSGETYSDVDTSSGDIRFYNNSAPSDGAALTINSNDPEHGTHATISQSYEEANNFTNNISSLASNSDALWDFALVDSSAPPVTFYCFRIVKSSGATLDTYSVIPEIRTNSPDYVQNYFRIYVDNDALDPTDPWPSGAVNIGENTEVTSADDPPINNARLRLRMSLLVSASQLVVSSQSFKLQFATRTTTCGAIGSWTDLGAPGGGALWRGFNATPADGTALSGNPPTAGDLNLSVSDRAGTYEEQNNTAVNPFAVSISEDVEYDWIVQANTAQPNTDYCFRMARISGTALDGYNFYPVIRTSGYNPRSKNWRWYTDSENETPTSSIDAENVAPASVLDGEILKLRLTLGEIAGIAGTNVKFKLQFSEYSDFSQDVFDVVASSSCGGASAWCYADGIDHDDDPIITRVLTDSTANGSHNESGTYTSSFDPSASTNTEFEFTLKNSGADTNTIYFFRPYNNASNAPVLLDTGEAYPSISTQGASLSFTIFGISSGTNIEGVTTDITTTPNNISFGTLSFGTEFEAGQRFNVSTNAENGYRILVYQRQGLLTSGAEINPVSGTNASPTGWSSGCSISASGCYGYHAGDDVLFGGSSRFAANDTYAGLDSTAREVVYSSGPVTDEATDIIYKIKANDIQANGDYQSNLVYIVVPEF